MLMPEYKRRLAISSAELYLQHETFPSSNEPCFSGERVCGYLSKIHESKWVNKILEGYFQHVRLRMLWKVTIRICFRQTYPSPRYPNLGNSVEVTTQQSYLNQKRDSIVSPWGSGIDVHMKWHWVTTWALSLWMSQNTTLQDRSHWISIINVARL